MCIIFTNLSSRPDDETLIRAQRRNEDGIGLAWRQDGLVHWEKGLKIEELLSKLHDSPPPFPNIIHFRVATSGGKKPELCHPFAVTAKASVALKGAAKAVLFHNGSWGEWQKEVKQAILVSNNQVPKGPWSDSRGMALLAGVYGPHIFNLLDVPGQRIAYFGTDSLLTWGTWEKKEGWWASNPTFQNQGCQLNIESNEAWRQNPERFDRTTKSLVPLNRRPSDGPKGGGRVTVIYDGRIVPEDGGENRSLTDMWTKKEITKFIFKLRIYAQRQGYIMGRDN